MFNVVSPLTKRIGIIFWNHLTIRSVPKTYTHIHTSSHTCSHTHTHTQTHTPSSVIKAAWSVGRLLSYVPSLRAGNPPFLSTGSQTVSNFVKTRFIYTLREFFYLCINVLSLEGKCSFPSAYFWTFTYTTKRNVRKSDQWRNQLTFCWPYRLSIYCSTEFERQCTMVQKWTDPQEEVKSKDV
jgi:hypothetical protein